MKSLFRYIMVVCMFTLFSNVVSAQERSGTVMDSKGEPIDLATVVLFAGERQVAVAVTDRVGRFTLSVVDGEYVLKIRNIVYKSLDQIVAVKTSVEDLGVFMLEESAVHLNEVVVSASAITREADRFVMRVSDVPSMLSKDVPEVLRLAPGVWVDDNGVSINGMKGAKVYINERELKLQEKELAAYLRNFRSSDIARIEVIPQSGAEYSADSRGGVIKIILRKQLENGVSGNVALNTLQGKFISDYKPSGTINARVGRWMLNGFAAGNITEKGKDEMTATRTLHSGEEVGFHSQSLMNNKMRMGIGRLGVLYEPDRRNSFGAEVEYSSKSKPVPSTAKTIVEEHGVVIHKTSDYHHNENDRNFSATFNYVYSMDTIGSSLKLITDYTDKKVTGDNDYYSFSEVQGFTFDSTYRSNSLSEYKIFTADLMLNKKLQGGMSFSAGAKYTHNDMSDTVLYESQHDLAWNALPDYSFAIDYTEDISAAYGTFGLNHGGLSLSAGLRGEHTSVYGKGDYVSRSYSNLFPNANVTYSFNAMRTFMLIGQYSRNIQRPNFWYLNPNRIQYSDYSYMVGNPHLRPTYINRISLTAVYKYRYVLSIGGTLHRDLIREVCKIDPADPNVTYITPENHHVENHYYVALSFPLRLAEWLNINANLVGVKQDIRGTENDAKKTHYLYFNNVTTHITLPEKFYAEVSYSGTSRLYSANSGIEPSHLFHVSLKKQLFNDRLTASLSVNNIFDSKVAYFSNMGQFRVKTKGSEAWSSRYVKIGVQYNFNAGKAFKKRMVENVSNGEKSRLEKAQDSNSK